MKHLNHTFQSFQPFKNQLTSCREVVTETINVIFSRPEAADDFISGTNIKILLKASTSVICVNFEVARVFNSITISHLCDAKTSVKPLAPYFRSRGAKNF